MAREMKDSGIAWIGEIPWEWKVSKLKYFVDCFDGRRVPVDAALRKSGPYPYWGAGSIMDYVDNYIFDEELVLLGEDGAPFFDYTRPVAFYINEKVWVNNHIHVLKPHHNVTTQYLVHYLNNVDYKTYINGSILNKLTQSNMNNITMLVPPLAEQRRIADFLDAECARIDAVIEQSRASIEEYKKLKQSVITQAVTKGIRPNRKMKDSGIEWFSKVPEEWAVSRIGLHYDIILGKMLCSVQPSEDYTLERYFCAANVHFDGISDVDTLKEMWFSSQEKQLYQVQNGDLLVVEGGAGAGGSAIVNGFTGTAFIQNSIMIVRAKNNRDNRYLRYLLEYLVKQGYIEVACNKATIPHFTKDKLATVPYPVTPAGEQTEIADYLDKKCCEIDRLIVSKQQFITELETYKKSLIYEYVTGKKEVLC